MDTRCLIIVLLGFFFICSVDGKLQFLPLLHDVRLHYNAPPDLLVTRVQAEDDENPDLPIQYSLHEVHDHKYFKVESDTGNVYTKDYVYLRIGQNLTITVIALDQKQAIAQTIGIHITEYNRKIPSFEYDIYRTEVAFTENINGTILQVVAHDNDSVPYNAELYYSILPGNWSELFSIGLRSGEIKLKRKLQVDTKLVQLELLVQDGGSPVRNNTAVVEIKIKALTAPRNVYHKNAMGHSVEICWDRPNVGVPFGYLVRFREAGAGSEAVRDVNVTSRNLTHVGSGYCTKLRGLQPWTDYEYRVYAWNSNETGLGSEIATFGTRSNYCRHHPCRNGRCIPTINNPGFTCDCDEGYYGTTCKHFNPCIKNPCGEYGKCYNTSDNQYQCECMEGFTGINCTAFDPCLARPSPCANGGTCTSTAPNTFKCTCRTGYYGHSCNFYNFCANKPCLNGGVCVNGSHSEFVCYCPPGFLGKTCEIDFDECASSPCWNGATCIDKANLFLCVCLPGFTGKLCNERDYCPEEKTTLKYGVFHWRKAPFNKTLQVPCPNGPFDKNQDAEPSYAKRSCIVAEDGKLVWSAVNVSNCKEDGFRIAENVTVELRQLTASPKNLSLTQFRTAANQIENVYSYALHDKEIATGMLSAISNMLDVDDQLFEKSNDSSDASTKLIDIVKKYTSSVSLDKGKSINFRSDNLVVKAINWNPNSVSMLARPIDTNQTQTRGIRFFGNKKHAHKVLRAVAEEADDETEEEEDEEAAALTVPEEALIKAQEQIEEEIRLQFISFKNAKFFRGKNNTDAFPDDPWQPVIIASISKANIANLTSPVTYIIPTSTKKAYYCAYWDEKFKKWLTDGIVTNQTGNATICSSSHMTAFSVLLDPDPHSSLSEEHKKTLSLISYIGCGLSIVGLVLTIITYSIFRCLNRDRSGKILLSLCVSMLLMNAAFLIGSQTGKSNLVDICVSVAILTHYFLLTTLSWMCVEAINMYQMLIQVFASSETRFMLKRSLAAWGLPFILVGATVAIDIGYYNNQNEYCLLSPNNPYVYYVTFLAPSCIILLVNCVVFILVTRVLFQPRITSHVNKECRKEKVTFAQVRGAFTVMTLLGITWVFGALAIGPAKVAFQYIFCVLNSLQGFIIFVVRCIQYPEARTAWSQLLKTGTLKKYRGGTPFGASSHSQGNGRGWSVHSQTSRTASGDTSTSGEKERKLSVASLTQYLRNATQRRRSSAASNKSSQKVKNEVKEEKKEEEKTQNTENVPAHDSSLPKEGRDTQWQYYCTMEEFRREIEARSPTSAPLLSTVNAEDLPFIEEDSPTSTIATISTTTTTTTTTTPSTTTTTNININTLKNPENGSDQGYSSLENSPNSSRILPETNSNVTLQEEKGENEGNELPRKVSLPTPKSSPIICGKKALNRSLTNPGLSPVESEVSDSKWNENEIEIDRNEAVKPIFNDKTMSKFADAEVLDVIDKILTDIDDKN